MATNFPGSLDVFTDQTAADLITSAKWNNMQDAIEACEAKLGVDSSAVTSSLDYLVKSTSSLNPGHKHTLANSATDVTASKDEINATCDGNTATAAELSELHSAGAVNADFVKLHAITNSAANLNAAVTTARTITAGTGLSGGGDLSADRTITHASHTGDVTGATALTIANNAVTTAKIANGAVTSTKIGAGALSESSLASAAVSQAKLKTSQGSVSYTTPAGGGDSNLILPGGEYGFYPQTYGRAYFAQMAYSMTAASYATIINLRSSSEGYTLYARQRYVTSSGEVHWVFVLRDKASKKVIAVYQAPDHPCFGNGGKPLVVAHPFCDFDSATQEIIVINPSKEEVEEIRSKMKGDDDSIPDRDFTQVVLDDYEIDEESSPAWVDVEVTVGLPTGHDWVNMVDSKVSTIKKIIPQHEDLITKSLKRKDK